MPDACRTCKASVVWGVSPQGKPSPINADPDPEKGNVLLLRQSHLGVLAIVLSGPVLQQAREARVELRTSHWATCADREQWREDTDRRRLEASG